MIRLVLRKIGIGNTTLIATVIAILISVFLTTFLLILLKGKVDLEIILISIIVPGAITPLLTGYLFVILEKLDHAENYLQKLVTVDELTRVNNRRQFIKLASNELARCKRYNNIFSILMMDIDKFKDINDYYGHLAGDKVLQALAHTCCSIIRPNDVLARFGGDEFVILLPMTESVEAEELAERIRQQLVKTPVITDQHKINFSVSIGIAPYTESILNLDQILINADLALYEAKRQGRNKVCVAKL